MPQRNLPKLSKAAWQPPKDNPYANDRRKLIVTKIKTTSTI
jgi:hypothetical protein